MSMLQYLRAGAFCLVAGFAAVLGGCSTAGSMLVEVDVYKGPLGKTKSVQLGEVAAIFQEAVPMLEFHEGLVGKYDCTNNPDPSGCQLLGNITSRSASVRCDMVRFISSLVNTVPGLSVRPKDLESCSIAGNGGSGKEMKQWAEDATRIATRLKVDAFYFAEAQIGMFPNDPVARYTLVGFINVMSELSNQIASRTDTLIKQADQKVEGKDLPLSDHLKDAGPTDFLYLFDWYQATLPDKLSEGDDKLLPPDRARLARRLFSDHYWTRINSVYASGQGKVGMALIKDDIGNWNLKSFDNDPTELLAAYRQLTLAGIEGAITLGKNISTGGSAAGLDVLSQFARGRVGSAQAATASSARIDSMRARAVSDLEEVLAAAKSKEADELARAEAGAQLRLNDATARVSKLRVDLQRATGNHAQIQQALDEALEKEVQAQAELSTAQQKHRAFMADLFAQARKALEIHRRVIDGLKEMQGASPTLTPAAAVIGR